MDGNLANARSRHQGIRTVTRRAVAACLASLLPALAWASPSLLDTTISYLLDYVSSSSCVFVRNGKEHDPEAAAEHMRKKYQWQRRQISTPEKFIELAATRSSMTGQPYLVKCPDSAERHIADWLTDALLAYRESSN